MGLMCALCGDQSMCEHDVMPSEPVSAIMSVNMDPSTGLKRPETVQELIYKEVSSDRWSTSEALSKQVSWVFTGGSQGGLLQR